MQATIFCTITCIGVNKDTTVIPLNHRVVNYYCIFHITSLPTKCKNLNLGKSEVRYFEGEHNNLKSIKRQ